MKISLSWIRDFVDLPALSTAEIANALTRHTAEVEGFEDLEELYKGMVVGHILSIKKHPGADKLVIAQTEIDHGKEVQIVCGGQNLYPGMLVPVALPGSKVKWHGEGDLIELTEATIRGEKSFGMICAGEEIGLTPDNTPDSKEVRICDLSELKVPVGTPLAKAIGKDDSILEVDNKSLTHRPDLWGHYGIAREFAAIFGRPLKKLDTFLKCKPTSLSARVKVDIKSAELCPRFSSCIMTGITVTESPDWLKARLRSAGMQPHNNIVDITNYVMLELGEPMHAYDRKIVGSDTLKVRFAHAKEKLLTLEGGEHELTAEDPLVCNEKNEPLGIAGVKGGLKSGITNETTEIILEAANFDPVAVRKSAMRNNLRTDASQRFEKSLDPLLTETAIRRAINLIEKLCPSAASGPITTAGEWKEKPRHITVDVKNLLSKIGISIPEKEIVRILKSLEFDVGKKGKLLSVVVPSHRATRDVSIEEDLIEEVARIHGYAKIPAVLPALETRLPLENPERFLKHLSRNIMAGQLGFTEVMTYSFYGADRFKKCFIPEEGHFKVLNYLSLDQTHMRTSMTPNLLAVIAQNCKENAAMKIFEFGRTYKDIGHFMPLEQKRLTAVVAEKSETFYSAKGALTSFLEAFRIKNYELKKSTELLPYAHPNKSIDLIIDGQNAGVLFSIHPGVLKNFDIPLSVSIFSVNFNLLSSHGRELQKFVPLPRFPGMSFDVSVLTEKTKTVAEMETIIRLADKNSLIVDISLFDIYEGKNIPAGKKSLSFSVSLRNKERTLTDAEFQELQSSVFKALEKSGGEIRK
ncbi:MAG: phenylalanine--tRNA ligase subunit beta [Candidatus Gracilibacteria bacterium]|jgi:phenylalanyl-tRNA synthetase beta chain